MWSDTSDGGPARPFRCTDGNETAKLSVHEAVLTFFVDPFFDRLAGALARVLELAGRAPTPGLPRRGPVTEHDPVFLLRCVVAAVWMGSVSDLVKHHGNRHVAADLAAYGVRLPSRIPTETQIRSFRDRLCDADVLPELEQLFREHSVARARDLGQFPALGTSDLLACLSDRSMVYGDGTTVTAYSNVREYPDRATGELLYLGSRADGGQPHRVQRHGTGTTEYVGGQGVNVTRVFTRTEHGRVVLATALVPSSEAVTAMELLDNVLRRVPRRVAVVVWDAALTGWTSGYLLARHGSLLVTRPVKAEEEGTARRELRLKAEAEAERQGLRPGKAVYASVVGAFLQRELDATLDSPRPLGDSRRVSTGKGAHVDVVSSLYWPLRRLRPHGTPCTHDLWVDDAQLWEVVDGLKVQSVVCEAAQRSGRVGLPFRPVSCFPPGVPGRWAASVDRAVAAGPPVGTQRPRLPGAADVGPVPPCEPPLSLLARRPPPGGRRVSAMAAQEPPRPPSPGTLPDRGRPAPRCPRARDGGQLLDLAAVAGRPLHRVAP